VRLFLDTSVLLSACASEKGTSREIFRLAPSKNWTLVATPYGLGEVEKNLYRLPVNALASWEALQPNLLILPNVLTLDRPAVFGPAKDRPILFSALAWADVLLTRDQNDFGQFFGRKFYDLVVFKPVEFLRRERAAGRL
jgi:predicted nucleic acid-binding protein